MDNQWMLMADDNSDLPATFFAENDIAVLKMNYVIDGTMYYCGDMTEQAFYALLRRGVLPTTTAANTDEIRAVMEPHVKAGMDVLYVAFSSAMSVTAEHGKAAARQLMDEYPGRRVLCIDSLCASLGEGLLIFYVDRLRKSGASMDEALDWIMDHRLRIAQTVMADDLMHLHRGGRISKVSAIAGSLIGVKPIIHLDDTGRLIPSDKARGKKKGLTMLVDYLEKCVGQSIPDYFMVSHADCREDADLLVDMMKARFGIEDHMLSWIGPVVGTHTGPGTVGAFIMGEHR